MNTYQKMLLLCLVVFLFLFINFIPYHCPFLTYFHVACSGCGLTRSFKSIICLDFNSAWHYNLLGIPLFCLCVVFFFLLCTDIVFKRNNFLNVFHILERHSLFLLFIVLINMLINNLK